MSNAKSALEAAKVLIEGKELIVTRKLAAPRELVFKAWTDARHLPQWWGPEGFMITTREIDIRVGGAWRFIMHGPDGTDYNNKIAYREIVEPSLIAYSLGDDESEHAQVQVTFEQQENFTLLTMRMTFPSAEALQQSVEEFRAVEGAQSTLNRLQQQLPKITLVRVNAPSFLLERVFNGPRNLVFKAFSEAEHLEKWWGPRGWILSANRMDFRPGGSWHYCMKCDDPEQGDFYGMESWGKAVYKEIVEGEKIVYLDYFSDADGHESQEMPAGEVTLTFTEIDGKTKVVCETRYPTEEHLQNVLNMGMEEGIVQTWDRLGEHLEAVQ